MNKFAGLLPLPKRLYNQLRSISDGNREIGMTYIHGVHRETFRAMELAVVERWM